LYIFFLSLSSAAIIYSSEVYTEIVLGKVFVLYWVHRSRIRWAGHVARIGDRWGGYEVLVGKTLETEALGRPMRNWDDDIKRDLPEVGW